MSQGANGVVFVLHWFTVRLPKRLPSVVLLSCSVLSSDSETFDVEMSMGQVAGVFQMSTKSKAGGIRGAKPTRKPGGRRIQPGERSCPELNEYRDLVSSPHAPCNTVGLAVPRRAGRRRCAKQKR
ncbi:uncharacterized protein PHACADRAFT_251570 [Phanerochaete carnosa HHB-10118-sp]|uniref:Uncharacterized protein n=1 Tax=Phanerochaete carnosa (strain HHB-10118-sp) TaxID=650164 RepID=K5WEN3_PHACS|nr:uncharacterized protein PHACADRAFT_251570 [Phanerochaete carnosa HHB-10118-sp]EKM57745.1 hypothetical protein PHACADRAFT_251570 [Phanerochaete carnosa HHB-10118-sp]